MCATQVKTYHVLRLGWAFKALPRLLVEHVVDKRLGVQAVKQVGRRGRLTLFKGLLTSSEVPSQRHDQLMLAALLILRCFFPQCSYLMPGEY